MLKVYLDNCLFKKMRDMLWTPSYHFFMKQSEGDLVHMKLFVSFCLDFINWSTQSALSWFQDFEQKHCVHCIVKITLWSSAGVSLLLLDLEYWNWWLINIGFWEDIEKINNEGVIWKEKIQKWQTRVECRAILCFVKRSEGYLVHKQIVCFILCWFYQLL